MKVVKNPIDGVVDIHSGELHIPSLRLDVGPKLRRADFLSMQLPLVIPDNPDTVQSYYLNSPVSVWGRQFMLSITFLPHTSPYCTGYGMRPLYAIERPSYEDSENSLDLSDMRTLVAGVFKREPRSVAIAKRDIWVFKWGIISIGSVMQNSSPVEVSVGWTR